MIPTWILELVGFAAAHASDDHGATCPTHADPEAECDCGLTEARELLAAVPDAVKGVALRAEPVAFDCREGGDVLPDVLVKPIASVAEVLNGATALGLMPPDMTSMVIGSVIAVGLDFAEGDDTIDGLMEIIEHGLRTRTLRKAVLLDSGTGLLSHLRLSEELDRSELSKNAITVLDNLQSVARVAVGEA
jgi:hypothetical protein